MVWETDYFAVGLKPAQPVMKVMLYRKMRSRREKERLVHGLPDAGYFTYAEPLRSRRLLPIWVQERPNFFAVADRHNIGLMSRAVHQLGVQWPS